MFGNFQNLLCSHIELINKKSKSRSTRGFSDDKIFLTTSATKTAILNFKYGTWRRIRGSGVLTSEKSSVEPDLLSLFYMETKN